MRSFGPLKASVLAGYVQDAVLSGDPNHKLSYVTPLDEAVVTSVCFMRTPDISLLKANAGLLIAPNSITLESIPVSVRPVALLTHPFPEAAWAVILAAVFPPEQIIFGKSSAAYISPKATFGKDVAVAAGAAIAEGAHIGARTQIGHGVTIGKNVTIGEECVIHPGVHIYSDVRIGNRCIIHSGTVIGSDGFGYTTDGKTVVKVPQIGSVTIGNSVEIGANCGIDRGAIGDTVVEDFVKIDNLVQIAHNCRIGAGTMVAAQAGFAGSTIIGKGVQVGGQAGFAGHLTVGDGAHISAKAGVIGDVAAGEEVSGFPARPRKEFMRMMAWLSRSAQNEKPGDSDPAKLKQ
jgi:UDP-3-O-[3-hydroxymyristoyl] glucosamine N-acyltransferase